MVGHTSRGASGPLYFIHRAWFHDEKYHPLSRDDPIDVCREYLIIVGSIPNGAGTMVLWFCSFL